MKKYWQIPYAGMLVTFFALLGINAALAADHQKHVTDVIQQDERLTTLAKAISDAGLGDALKGDGPFTVFAPNNKAFEQLPRGTLDDLMKDKAKLAKVLKYHVIDGQKVMLEDKTKGKQALKTLEGSPVELTKPKKKRFFVNKSLVLHKDDGHALNGVVHIIDRVLLPPGV